MLETITDTERRQAKMSDKHIKRRIALCKALFLAPKEIFIRIDSYINLCLDCHIRDITGHMPNDKFPLDFWADKDPLTPPPWPPKIEGENKGPGERAALCKMLFLMPPRMFRDIERLFNNQLVGYIKEKTGRKHMLVNLDEWINRGTEKAVIALATERGKQ
ncbi:MAG: hypothetical protein J6U56_04515 [Spirochaetia bacterium]|nr:hypothetical protein [Spirochaetia bacterium]